MGSEGSIIKGETLNLDNWFSTASSPANQSCIDVFTFIISLLRVEQTQLGNVASGNSEIRKLKTNIS
uniref:Uncharacterized protein n=1 Tax=Daphnia galeata TaxID=27404 RepID=A0A8J2WNQ9_9CRUS|nr:unnamed protein product [Daphnia galeata]